MSPSCTLIGRKAVCVAGGVLCLGWLGVPLATGEDAIEGGLPESEANVLPKPVAADAFATVIANSPFVRSLGLSNSIILTGLARIDNEVVATLLDTDTMESQVVTEMANAQGWQLVGVGGDEANLGTLSAKIQVDGGEVISIRYAVPPKITSKQKSGGGSRSGSSSLKPSHLEEAKKAAVNYREGFSSDGFPKEPPAEVVKKLSKLSVGQREDINRRMIGLRNQGLGMEERRRIYVEMVDRSVQR